MIRPEQLRELKSLLDTRRAVLDSETAEDIIRAREESYRVVAGAVTDRADEAAADLLTGLDQAEVTRDLRELRAIESAQQRITDGTYGDCADCGSDIGIARLRAHPTATRCIRCQGTYERAYPQEGAARL